MKRLRAKYNKMRWSSRFIGFAITLGIALAVSYTAGWNLIVTTLAVTAIAVALHFLIDTTSRIMTGLVLLLQIGTMWPIYTLYANFVGTSMLNGAYIYSVIVVSISTIVITVIAARYSVGRLWITLFLSFLGLNILGPLAMAFLRTSSVIPALIVAGIILATRCVLWRDIFAKRSRHIPGGMKKPEGNDTLRNLLLNIDGVEIQDRKEYPIDFVAKAGENSYYINAVHLNQRIVASGESVASGQFNLNSTLYRTAELADSMEKSLKRKERGNVIPCIVNIADNNNSKLEFKIQLRGDQRGHGKNTLILSPAALTKMIAKDAKGVANLEKPKVEA